MKHAVMNDKNRSSNHKEHTVRITRAQAKALSSSSGLPPLYPSVKQADKQVLRANSKRAAVDSHKPEASTAACPQRKRRAVLKDVTNVTCENLYTNCIYAARNQSSGQERKSSLQKKKKIAPACFARNSKVSGDKRENLGDDINKIKVEESGDKRENLGDDINKIKVEESPENGSKENLKVEPTEYINSKRSCAAGVNPLKIESSEHIMPISLSNKGGGKVCTKQENLDERGIIDIDSENKDPLMCSLYAPDIYSNLSARQVDRRPLSDYMEKLQKDISQSMRGILIDWLVEVCEEYGLTGDTLYLTVNLIDRFLSVNYIEKQKLQLLGITCMLIASKYEEICAPRVEEFCFITDSTYTKEEVVQMESRVLNLLSFQLSVPTTQKFLRRFIQAAQVSNEVPSVELEFLASYLAELTLIDYNFLKFLPSQVAASAVFLARWTLDQSDHPWNSTLEHYTRYNTSQLKSTVLELQDLQLNTRGCMLKAIRDKYKQSKLKSVSILIAKKPVQSLFET